jgi:hypothetical protein
MVPIVPLNLEEGFLFYFFGLFGVLSRVYLLGYLNHE